MDEQHQPETNQPDTFDDVPSQPMNDYVKQLAVVQQPKRRRTIRLIVVLAVFVLALAVGGYFYQKHKSSQKAAQQQPVSQAAVQPKVAISSQTTRYSSSQFFLEFDQPSDWQVKDDPASGVLTATSPNLSIPAAGGGVTTGRVTFTIRAKTQKLPEFDIGNATAVIDSEKVAYNKPSQSQRGQTYLSYLSYPASASSGLIDGIYITGDFGYQKGQAIPKVDIQKIDPIISLTFTACDGTCTKAIGITPEAWASADFGGVLKKLLQSLTIN